MIHTSLIAICILLALFLTVAEQLLRRRQEDRLVTLLATQSYGPFQKECDRLLTRLVIPNYHLQYLKLNSALLQKQAGPAREQLELLMRMRKSKAQTKDLLMKAFGFYLEQGDARECQTCIEEMKAIDPQPVHDMEMIHAIYLKNSSDYIQELQERVKTADKEERALYDHLIAVQRSNQKKH